MGFGYSILLWIILQFFLSSADIFQKLAFIISNIFDPDQMGNFV